MSAFFSLHWGGGVERWLRCPPTSRMTTCLRIKYDCFSQNNNPLSRNCWPRASIHVSLGSTVMCVNSTGADLFSVRPWNGLLEIPPLLTPGSCSLGVKRGGNYQSMPNENATQVVMGLFLFIEYANVITRITWLPLYFLNCFFFVTNLLFSCHFSEGGYRYKNNQMIT